MVFPFGQIRKLFANSAPPPDDKTPVREREVSRHFYNENEFQTYASFFRAWGGWITAGHVLDAAQDIIPPFARGAMKKWPGALDAALIGCTPPPNRPKDPVPGMGVKCIGFPAGSEQPASRTGKVYMERPGQVDVWIAHILTPDEPVVTGMSGGIVLDTLSEKPIGIIVTRNSPADLNADRDPDESFDFVSLAGVWRAVQNDKSFV